MFCDLAFHTYYSRTSSNSLFAFLQSNEIDLDALLLMSEKDFSEIGLPEVEFPNCARHFVHHVCTACTPVGTSIEAPHSVGSQAKQ